MPKTDRYSQLVWDGLLTLNEARTLRGFNELAKEVGAAEEWTPLDARGVGIDVSSTDGVVNISFLHKGGQTCVKMTPSAAALLGKRIQGAGQAANGAFASQGMHGAVRVIADQAPESKAA